MTRSVAVVYDDTRRPGRDIARITGNKSFGQTIYKRQTVHDMTAAVYTAMPNVSCFVDAGSKEMTALSDTPVVLHFSDFGIAKVKDVETVVYKAGYAHENYKVTQGGRIACVIFPDEKEFFRAKPADLDTYTEIASDAYTDLSDPANFRSFITGGFDARFFNSLTGDGYTVVKTSKKKEKIRAEYKFYDLLPDDMKQWFVRPFDFKEDDDTASYRMQRYNMTDLAIRYVHGSISEEEFADILRLLFYFLSHRKTEAVTEVEYEACAKELYVTKVYERINALKEMSGYDRLSALIRDLTDYRDIDEIAARYMSMYERIRKGRKFDLVKTVSHGDMCFSNILYSNADSQLVLVDPKGATDPKDLYMDGYYDIAKLSHSICGHYDFFNSGLYGIAVGEDMKAYVTVDADNRRFMDMFAKSLSQEGIDLKLIRLYEASLFLSMLPYHMDRPRKVFAFILNAIAILDSLER
ncbi:MAG: hypothetical protein IKQ40_04585 [Lachnospiraceae bacterium]|nr:hypothetical protein [Lachnospiraceae bacterium]